MRISTNQMYQNGLNALLSQQGKVSILQQQLASGVKVQSASDDPIAYSQMEWLNQRVSSTELFQKNCLNAENILSLEETLLGNYADNLQRLREIQLQAGNSTFSESQRHALAIEAQDILNQVLAFANSRDNDGSYLFSGGQTGLQPFSLDANGEYVYNGDSTQRFQLISNSLQIAINDPGDQVFMRIPQGNGHFKVEANSVNAGTGSISTGSIVDASAYVADDYHLSFAQNTQGALVVLVQGTDSGNVIPSTGLVDDAPLYQEGMSISFNGMTMQLSGQPQASDSFAISPSKKQSIFTTIQTMIHSLNAPFNKASEKATVVTTNNQLLAEFDSALKIVSTSIANLGARINQVAYTKNANEDLLEASKVTLKQLREIDPVSVATEFNQDLVNLQAAQQSFVRIQSLSIFNYI